MPYFLIFCLILAASDGDYFPYLNMSGLAGFIFILLGRRLFQHETRTLSYGKGVSSRRALAK